MEPCLDGWASNASIFSGVTRDELRQSKEKQKDEKNDKRYMLDNVSKQTHMHVKKLLRHIC